MGFIIPAGRTSSVTWEGKIFQVQTEFVTRPNPKVVSSIILDGKLIHKVEKPWKGEIKAEEQKEVEQFLKKEHEKEAPGFPSAVLHTESPEPKACLSSN